MLSRRASRLVDNPGDKTLSTATARGSLTRAAALFLLGLSGALPSTEPSATVVIGYLQAPPKALDDHRWEERGPVGAALNTGHGKRITQRSGERTVTIVIFRPEAGQIYPPSDRATEPSPRGQDPLPRATAVALACIIRGHKSATRKGHVTKIVTRFAPSQSLERNARAAHGSSRVARRRLRRKCDGPGKA